MTTPNMGLDLPVVSTTPGPQWATKNNAALEVIDEHDHSSGKGAAIPSTAIEWTDDTDVGAVVLFDVGALALAPKNTPPDYTSVLYVDSDGELHFIDGAGNDLKATLAGVLNIPADGIKGTYATDVAVPGLNYSTTDKRYVFTKDAVGNLAQVRLGSLMVGYLAVSANTVITNTDGLHTLGVNTGANVTITLPAAIANFGRQITIKDATGTAATHNITVARTGADTIDGATSATISTNRGVLRLIGDAGANQWLVV